MKKFLIILLIVVPFVYAYYHKPLFKAHQEKIHLSAIGTDAAPDDNLFDLPQWDGLEYADWLFFSGTRDKKQYSLVSFGMVDHVFVVDSEWAPKVFEIKRKEGS